MAKALKGKPFKHYEFRNNDLGRYGIRALIDVIDSNPELISLTLHDNRIDPEDQADFINSIARHPNLSAISLDNCDQTGYLCAGLSGLQWVEFSSKYSNWGSVSDTDKQSLIGTLAAPDTWLEKLDLSGNNLTDNDAAIIANALKTNNTLIELVLKKNRQFTERCGQLFGNALRANRTLEILSLDGHIIGNALFDRSSLNSASDSNHICTCYVPHSVADLNERDDAAGNRHRKIYNVLAYRHAYRYEEMSNTQHFGDIDVNLLPEILLAVQNYSSATPSIYFTYDINEEVNALSIVHEIMLKWDKALALYETLGSSCDEA